ncbi:hypothetical protein AB595_05355 [Massilia sp. WF1]|uniref:DUF1653 domain-containing protein n=1 Tax=unclassified Massilia TaxID=2609279 RepID=UPI00064ADDCE|nr:MULTISPECIES: DUF1653 domain-containing protein [unclassified Massilia]ALK96394.1 hypothetical protein AM586_08985 [Massilia sp. WG5]KLU37851.1 hypothetical protein AB595_05355 [Massilia sp. WF1]
MRYRHYKGGVYELVCEAVIEADHTPVIVYRGEDGRTWVRPKDAFFETVEVDGACVPRFALMSAPALP